MLKFRTAVIIITLLACLVSVGTAQERVKRGKQYNAGDTVNAPLYGIRAIIPDGLSGDLVQEAQIFVLRPQQHAEANFYVRASKERLETIKERWTRDFEFSPGIVLQPKMIAMGTGYTLSAEFTLSNRAEHRVYAKAKCGPYGYCAAVLLMVHQKFYAGLQKKLDELAANIYFAAPSLEDYYGDILWKSYLQNKYIFTRSGYGKTKRENNLWLCNGRFKTKLRRGLLIKGEIGDYRGTHKGTYSIAGEGKEGLLTLTFEKLPEVDLKLEIDNDEVFINGQRYFLIYNERCKE